MQELVFFAYKVGVFFGLEVAEWHGSARLAISEVKSHFYSSFNKIVGEWKTSSLALINLSRS